MGYTTPFTAVAGTAWKAADWNTYGRDNLAWIATDSPACRVYSSVNVSCANVTEVALAMNSERYDNASMHSTSSNTSRVTVPTGGGGKYLLGGTIQWANAAGNERNVQVRLNGATRIVVQASAPVAGGLVTKQSCMGVYAMVAADYGELIAYQDSGGAVNVQAASAYSPEFFAFWFRT